MSKGKLIGWRSVGPNTGEFVEASDGFGYACTQVGIEAFDETALEADDFKEMLIEWFFSGNWVEVHENG